MLQMIQFCTLLFYCVSFFCDIDVEPLVAAAASSASRFSLAARLTAISSSNGLNIQTPEKTPMPVATNIPSSSPVRLRKLGPKPNLLKNQFVLGALNIVFFCVDSGSKRWVYSIVCIILSC